MKRGRRTALPLGLVRGSMHVKPVFGFVLAEGNEASLTVFKGPRL